MHVKAQQHENSLRLDARKAILLLLRNKLMRIRAFCTAHLQITYGTNFNQ